MKHLWFSLICFAASVSLASAAVFTVTNTNDSGLGSLRQAILDANANPGADKISFAMVGSGVQTIAPLSALPDITNTVAINGYSQTGSGANTLTNGDDAVILIRLDGVNLTTGLPAALTLQANGSAVRGLILVRCPYGIKIDGASDCVIAGNWIGMDADGLSRGMAFDGISVTHTLGVATNNTIGGTAPADRNVISGNGTGVSFFPSGASQNAVVGNFIGTDPSGTLPRGNLFTGVRVQGATNITVGGAAVGARNLLCACTAAGGRGVSILGGGGDLIQGNLIGTDVSGQYDLGNSSDGVMVQGASNVRVLGNQIANNLGSGILLLGASATVVEGNYIGTDATATRPLGNALAGVSISGNTNRVGGLSVGQPNTIQFNGEAGVAVDSGTQNEVSANRIFDNGGPGIDLDTDGVTTNDEGDPDSGANQLQNFPVLTNALSAYGSIQIQGTLNSTANSTFRLEFFASPGWDSAGILEGQLFLGAITINTGVDGNAAFNATLSGAPPADCFVTSTATDANGNTSEFSSGIPLAVGPQSFALSITNADGTVKVTWPAAASLYRLEATGSLNPTWPWHTITSGIVELGQWRSYSVTNAAATGNQFFRLKKS
jgi:parallel beta-helix repeat protein